MGKQKKRNPLVHALKILVLYPLWSPPLKRWRQRRKEARSVFNLEPNISMEEWERRGRPNPPPHQVKRNIIAEFAKRFKTPILIETGTYKGDMIEAMLPNFQRLLSIELSKELHAEAARRFAGQHQVSILQGDSSVVLADILKTLDQPGLFWLDGHYSIGPTAKGDLNTPIRRELDLIFRHSLKNHVILIDDARLFVGANDYPSTEEVRRLVQEQPHQLTMDVADDVIRIYPAG
jgi:hypothetical protein